MRPEGDRVKRGSVTATASPEFAYRDKKLGERMTS